MFAIRIQPIETAEYAGSANLLLSVYLCYSLIVILVARWTDIAWPRMGFVIHALDLSVLTVLMFLTDSPSVLFLAFFVFCLISATMRWQTWGTICTAVIGICIRVAIDVSTADFFIDPELNMTELIFHVGYLSIVATLVGVFGACEKAQRTVLADLAAWPTTIPDEIYPLVSEILQRSSDILAAPRTLLIWKEEEEPLIHTASWIRGQFQHSIETFDMFGTMVAEGLMGEDFFCRDALARKPKVLCSSLNGFERWEGIPINTDLQNRYLIKSVLSVVLQSESVAGRLFALDRDNMDSDDLVLGRILSHAVSCNLDQFYAQKRIQIEVAAEERTRLARDLHDGPLQFLTGTGLQLNAAHRLLFKEPQDAQKRLLDIQKMIFEEQQSIRSHIRLLKSPHLSLPKWDLDLPKRLQELAERINSQWGMRVAIGENLNFTKLPWAMTQEVYFIIHEALINAARHADASFVWAEIGSTDQSINIVVTDDGRGFTFTGCHDHATLIENNLGPVVLRERVTSLGGSLFVESGSSGARLEINLPIPESMN